MQNEIVYLYLDDIIPNRFQPREVFDEEALKELAISIKEHGVIQPIIVRQVNNKYEIIAGERRYKASTIAGLTKIPAIIRNLDDKESSKIALIENLQRRDLTPIEEARTYQKILELEEGMTQDELAQTMGKTQSAVSNKLRLLSLPEEVQYALLNEQISERHARCLLNLEDKNQQIRLLERIIATRMTVKELEKEIKMFREQDPNSVFGIGYDTNISNENVEETVKPYTAVELNPTEVDINRIRQNSVDINPAAPPAASSNTLMSSGDNSSSGFRFMPNEVNEPNNDTEGGGAMYSPSNNVFGVGDSGSSFGINNSFQANNNPPNNAFGVSGNNNFGGDNNNNFQSSNNSFDVPVPVVNSQPDNSNTSSLFGGIPLVNELPKMDIASSYSDASNTMGNAGNPTMDFNNSFLPGITSAQNEQAPSMNNNGMGMPTNNNRGVVNSMLSDIPSMNMETVSNNNFINNSIETPKPDFMSPPSGSGFLDGSGKSSMPDLMSGGLSLREAANATIMDAVNRVRDAVKDVEKLGYSASIEELDIVNEYQILIKINKD